MKALRKILDDVKPNFQKGGKFEKLHSVFDGFETFLFVPNHTTHSGTHIKDNIDMKRTMFTVVIAMVPVMLFGMWNTGHHYYASIGEYLALNEGFLDKFIYGLIATLPLITVSYSVGLGIEFLFAQLRGHSINEGFLVSGLLIPLCLPVEVPLWMVGLATAFAVVIGKEVFGGTGMNILNPALTARAFLFFAYPTKMSGNDVWISVPRDTAGVPSGVVDAYTGETALGELASTVKMSVSSDAAQSVLAKFGPDGAYSLSNAFFGFIPGSIGETSAFACLIGAAILLFTGIGSWRIMLSFFVGGLAMAGLFNLWGANAFMSIPPVHQLMIGGFMFGMVFMSTDPVSAAQTDTGKLIYGFLAGFFGIMIRVFNPAYPEGIMLSILLMNVMAPMIDHYVVQANINRRAKRMAAAKIHESLALETVKA